MVVLKRVKLISIVFEKGKFTHVNFFIKGLTHGEIFLIQLREVIFGQSRNSRYFRYSRFGFILFNFFKLAAFFLNEPFNLSLIRILGLNPIKIISTQMMNIIMKVQCRHTISQIILTDSQLINRYLLIILIINKYRQLHCISILLKRFLILHLVTVQFTQIKTCFQGQVIEL